MYLPQGEPSKKKPRQERKIWTWSSGDLPPQDMPDNKVKSKGMEECSYPVDYFVKIFGRATIDLLLEQSNIHRLNVSCIQVYVPYIYIGGCVCIGVCIYASITCKIQSIQIWLNCRKIFDSYYLF